VTRDRRTQPVRPAAELAALLVGPPLLTLAVAESVTCGRVQAAIGAVSGASRYFLGGITTYAGAVKVTQLGVDEALVRATNAVSAEVAAAMAIGACRKFGSDLAVATTGYAEAAPEHGFAEPGAFWAVARSGREGGRVVRHGLFKGIGLGRVPLQEAVVGEVLGALTEYVRTIRAAEAGSRFA
jgi:nicotinamide-nucleotide amidase